MRPGTTDPRIDRIGESRRGVRGRHFAEPAINGGIVIFLCTNLGNAPPGTTSGRQACPTSAGTVSGTATPADVGPGAAAQGISAGEFAKVLAAIRVGATYANIHTSQRPGGEIRGQIHSHGD
jgi:CHRD domain-containing protein